MAPLYPLPPALCLSVLIEEESLDCVCYKFISLFLSYDWLALSQLVGELATEESRVQEILRFVRERRFETIPVYFQLTLEDFEH